MVAAMVTEAAATATAGTATAVAGTAMVDMAAPRVVAADAAGPILARVAV